MTENRSPLKIGMSACFFHADPERAIFKGKTLLYVEQSMADYLMTHGALPVLLPPATAGFGAADLLSEVSGLLLQGGSDVSPESYGEKAKDPKWAGDIVRDRYEIELAKEAIAQGMPVLGICRGAQLLNVALGGTLYQDIETQVPGSLVHRDWDVYDELSHDIEIASDSRLAEIYPGQDRARVNSVHHQSIKDLAPSLQVAARSVEDDVIEAVWQQQAGEGYVLGIQWHPEFMEKSAQDLLDPAPIMDDFLDSASRYNN